MSVSSIILPYQNTIGAQSTKICFLTSLKIRTTMIRLLSWWVLIRTLFLTWQWSDLSVSSHELCCVSFYKGTDFIMISLHSWPSYQISFQRPYFWKPLYWGRTVNISLSANQHSVHKVFLDKIEQVNNNNTNNLIAAWPIYKD